MTTEQYNPSEKVNRGSFLGIAPVISALLAFLFLVVDFAWFYISLRIDPEGKTVPPFLYSLSFIISNFLCIVLPIIAGVAFGIFNLFHKYRNKSLAIIGIILCLVTGILSCLSFIGLFVWLVILGLSGV